MFPIRDSFHVDKSQCVEMALVVRHYCTGTYCSHHSLLDDVEALEPIKGFQTQTCVFNVLERVRKAYIRMGAGTKFRERGCTNWQIRRTAQVVKRILQRICRIAALSDTQLCPVPFV